MVKLDGPPPKEDPGRPDIYVPPVYEPGKIQYILRWDEKAQNYAVIGTNNADGSVTMLDKDTYNKTNESQLNQADAYHVPPKESDSLNDFYYPPNGTVKNIVRYDVTTGEYLVVGVNKDGQDHYYPNKQVCNYATAAFKSNYPDFKPPLPAPVKGVQAPWGGSDAHPSFMGPATNGDGKTYMWAWDEKYHRYMAVGTIENDGKTVHMFDLNEYRKLNGGPDALRPPEDKIPKPLPEKDPYGPQDSTYYSPPKQITILFPPKPGESQMQSVTGEAIYRTDRNTGELVIVGIKIKGNPDAKPPVQDKYYYFRPDEFDLYNPGGKAREDLPESKTSTPKDYREGDPHPGPYKEKDFPTGKTVAALENWCKDHNIKTYYNPYTEKLIIVTSDGKEIIVSVNQPLSQKTLDDLKKLGFPLD